MALLLMTCSSYLEGAKLCQHAVLRMVQLPRPLIYYAGIGVYEKRFQEGND
jgi:hypothetical protein